mgnify:FL=1
MASADLTAEPAARSGSLPVCPVGDFESRRVVGSSVLAYGIDESWGNVYILLGKEQHVPGWNGSEKWSDFGGAAHAQESPPYTAAREFHEETCACVPFYAGEAMPRRSYVPLAEALQAGEYTFKLETPVGRDGVYITYILQIPLQPEVTEAVERTRAALAALRAGSPDLAPSAALQGHPAIDGRGALNVDYMEKSTVRFWSAVQLKRACGSQAGTIQCRNRSNPTHQEQLRGTFRHRLRIVISEFPTEFAAASVDAEGVEGAFKRPMKVCFDTYNNTYNNSLPSPCPPDSSIANSTRRPPPGLTMCPH